jgi:hypothetical protein
MAQFTAQDAGLSVRAKAIHWSKAPWRFGFLCLYSQIFGGCLRKLVWDAGAVLAGNACRPG